MSSFVLDFFSLHNSFFKTSTPFSLPPPPPRRFLLHPKMAFAQSMRASVQARPTSSRSRAGVRAVALVRRENAQAEKKKKNALSLSSLAAGHQKKIDEQIASRSPDSSPCLGSCCFCFPSPPSHRSCPEEVAEIQIRTNASQFTYPVSRNSKSYLPFRRARALLPLRRRRRLAALRARPPPPSSPPPRRPPPALPRRRVPMSPNTPWRP